MNPRRRRHNKRARALREFARRYRDWIRFREGTRGAIMAEACKATQDAMAKLLNEVVVPEVAGKVWPRGYVPAISVPVFFYEPEAKP